MNIPPQKNTSVQNDLKSLEGAPTDQQIPVMYPLKKTFLEGSLDGPFGIFYLSHFFSLSHSDSQTPVEAHYHFPLPAEAAVLGFTIQCPEKIINGFLIPRHNAESRYIEAKSQNIFSAILTRNSHDIFSLRTSGIAPDESITATTHFTQLASPSQSGYIFRIPVAVPPRYSSDYGRYSSNQHSQPLLLLRNPEHQFQFHITTENDVDVKSSHSMLLCRESGTTTILSHPGLPRRDCIIITEDPGVKEQPLIRIFPDDQDNTHFFALFSLPIRSQKPQSRDIIFIIDHSESMRSSKRMSADLAAEKALLRQSEADRFNVCLVVSRTCWLFEQPVPATPAHITKALKFLQNEESGGTELETALKETLNQLKRTGDVSHHCFIVTDGHVGDIGRILQRVEEGSKDKDGWRYSILCIDGSPGAYLAERIAKKGMGVIQYLGSYPTEDEISEALKTIFSEWEYPLRVNPAFRVNRQKVYADRGTVENCSDGSCLINPGPSVSGKQEWLAGRCVQGKNPVRFEVAGLSGNQVALHDSTHSMIIPLSIARYIAHLEELKSADYSQENIMSSLNQLGYFMSEEPDHEPDSSNSDTRAHLSNLLCKASLKHGVISSETAFFIASDKHAKCLGEPVIIPNALPIGWSDQFLNRYIS
jgi:hypothetical protein